MEKWTDPFFRGLKGSLGEALEILSLAVIAAIFMRIFLLEPYYIPSGSMLPLLQPGDRILVNKLVYRIGQPGRGDVVVFKFPLDEKKDYIKRIIALPGETIEGKENRIWIDGVMLEETYLSSDAKFGDFGPVRMGGGEYFVLGDNRQDSQDSRSWGPLSREQVRGKAMLLYWPISRTTWLGKNT